MVPDLNLERDRENFVWEIAKSLRGAYRPHDYGKVILPMTVLRRFDSVIAPTRAAVWAAEREYQDIPDRDELLFHAANGLRIFNKSPFDLARVLDDPENTARHLREYIAGFSTNAREILERFDFHRQISKLDEKDRLRPVLARFVEVDLHPSRVPNETMGAIFENLIGRFYELANEEAGDYFTPREIIRLMVDLLFAGDAEALTRDGIVRTVYDPAAGTGGMLSVAGEYFEDLNPRGSLELFGQDYNDESYAIARADMLLRGNVESNIHLGNSLIDDGVAHMRFDYMLSNPPYGVDWGDYHEPIEAEYEREKPEGRFGAGLPPRDDGALLFLQHMISKMKPVQDGGSRIAIVLSGSPLFAGAGIAGIRAWLLEQDLVEAIVALPEQMFFNTGIATYIWIVTNRKDPLREGLVQLIDAREMGEPLEKSIGEKRRRLSQEDIDAITRLHGDMARSRESKMAAVDQEFRYDRVTVNRPLFVRYDIGAASLERLEEATVFRNLSVARRGSRDPDAQVARGEAIQNAIRTVFRAARSRSTLDREKFESWLATDILAAVPGRVPKAVVDAVRKACEVPDPQGQAARDRHGAVRADPESRDYENVLHGKSIERFLEGDVRPWAPHAWIDHDKTMPGYVIPFKRMFYRPDLPRSLSAIDSDIAAISRDLRSLLGDLGA